MSKFKGKIGRGLFIALAMVCYVVASVAVEVSFSVSKAEKEIQTPNPPTHNNTAEEDTSGQETAMVDYDADVMVNRGDEVIRLIGNVHFHHKGTIIQCDSALQYPDDRMEFFSRVIIEKDSALIYGDRVYYDGTTSLADVFAPIVKMTRGDAILYSYNLQFNTETSIGYFHNGGVLSQKENLIEAKKGYFDADHNYVKFEDEVAARNNTYTIKTDSMGFNIDAEQLDFLTRTYIWDNDRDFLQAESGHYFSATKSYLFYENAYILTPDNELWADTLRYLTEDKQAYLFTNVQILDSTNTTVAFGDWAFYDDSLERAILSKKPSVRAWDTKEDEQPTDGRRIKYDTTYMRADTIIMVTLLPEKEDTLSGVDSSAMFAHDSMMMGAMGEKPKFDDTFVTADAVESVHNSAMPTLLDTLVQRDTLIYDSLMIGGVVDSLVVVDSVVVADSVVVDIPIAQEQAVIEPIAEEQAIVEPIVDTLIMTVQDTIVSDSLPMQDVIIDTVGLDSIVYDSIVYDSLPSDSTGRVRLPAMDSLLMDSLRMDSLVMDSLSGDTIVEEPAVPRLIKAYHNMRMWSAEFQAKCDSLVSYSVDSTMVMFGLPVLWNDNNQITSERVELYTKEGDLDWAFLSGDPFITQQLFRDDTLLINQATGDEMEVYFTDNELDYTVLIGNVQNIYYMSEDNKVNAFVAIESEELTMEFVEREPVKMTWSGKGKGPIYPMDQIPKDQARYLTGFTDQDSIRPKSAVEICPRIERPSQKEEALRVVKPNFKIDMLMTQRKKKFIEKGEWRDRSEWPDVTVEYFEKNNEQLLF